MDGSVFLIGEHDGDDMCGGLDIAAACLTREDGERLLAAIQDQEPGWGRIIEIPLNTTGWLGYTSYEFIPDA